MVVGIMVHKNTYFNVKHKKEEFKINREQWFDVVDIWKMYQSFEGSTRQWNNRKISSICFIFSLGFKRMFYRGMSFENDKNKKVKEVKV